MKLKIYLCKQTQKDLKSHKIKSGHENKPSQTTWIQQLGPMKTQFHLCDFQYIFHYECQNTLEYLNKIMTINVNEV